MGSPEIFSNGARLDQVLRLPGGARIARSFGAERTFVERLERMPAAEDRAGRRRVLLLDSTKIGTAALYSLCPVNLCDLIVTDGGVGRAALARLRKSAEVMVAT